MLVSNKKKYYVIDRSEGVYLTEKGYFKIYGGILFKTNGFDKYANEHGIIVKPNLVTYKQFEYDFNVPFKNYFIKKYEIKVNTRLRIIIYDNESTQYEKIPIYVFLNWKERLSLSYRFNRLLIQNSNFWMWVINVVVALGATIAGLLVVFCELS